MYNHYIPQSDGSFRRNSVPEGSRRPQQRPPQRPAPPPKPEPKPEPCPPPQPEPCQPPKQERKQENPLSFLRKLLPKELDSSDLVIIALLLLLSGEDCDGDTAPLLTLALYFLL